MMINVFVVDGPFQLLSAMEAKERFSEKEIPNFLIIRYLKNKQNEKQIENSLKLAEWDEVIKIYPSLFDFSTFVKTLLLVKRLKRKYKVNHLFIGGFFYPAFHFFQSNLNVKDSYLLDDGNTTIDIHKRMELEAKFIDLRKDIKMWRLRSLFYTILRLKVPEKLEYNFFTFFDLKELPSIQIVKNDFSFCKRKLASKEFDEKKVYFLGSPLVEMNIVSEAYYFEYLDKVKSFYDQNNVKLIYVKHRRESEKYTHRIHDLGMEIEHFDLPIELEVLSQDSFAFTICSFISTALMSLKNISDRLHITSYVLKSDCVSEKFREEFDGIYEVYKKDIEVIDLN